MLSLSEGQGNFIDTINDGPDALHPELFAGPLDRILLGLKTHANTISHARLVALEQTFPLTRQELGGAQFSALTRAFVDTGFARASDNNRIGIGFPEFLGDPVVTELAQIEWAWLESYHAAEAAPMTLADLAALDESALLATPVSAHPAARLVPIEHSIPASLSELAGQRPTAILIVRPDAEVRLIPLEENEAAVFRAANRNNATLGNLLTAAIEQTSDADPSGPVTKLIGAGALVLGG